MYSIEQRDEQVFGTTSQIRYHLHFERAPQHLLVVEMEIDTTEQQLTLVMPSWTPGSYKIREFVAHQGNLHVQDNQGNNLPYEWKTKNILSITSNGSATVKVRYTYYANERTVRTMHINRWRAFIMPVNCLMYVDGRMNEVHHVYLHHNTQAWKQVSTALSPVTHESNPVIVGALNYDVLADSPIEIGNHQVQSFEVCGAKHEVALVAPLELDIDWLTQQCQVIVETEAQIFGGVPYDRYVFMVQVGMNVYGGLEHSRCSVNLVDIGQMTDKSKAGTLLALLCHEFFHTWNIKRIRPVEYGPFDYINECYSPMLWLAEGFTSYYDDLLSYRCGFMSRDEYISALGSDHLAKLERVPGRKAMNTRDASFLAWVKLYAQSPDGNNRHPSYYLKGGIITLMIELYVIAKSNGTKRLDDVMRELWKMYLERPEQGVTEQEVYSAISTSTGIDCAALLSGMLHGTDDIDYNKFLAPFGLEWTSDITVSPKVFAGMNTKDDGGKVVITSVEDDTPAVLCGLSIDDEILAVNGLRVTSTGGLVELLQRNGTLQPAQILASCDGKVFEVQLTPSAKQEYRLVVKSTITEEQRTLLNYWLER
ncbi:MAG: PDZ domain-containing protein [Candidatus Kapaibacterium sp.]|nr:PDZ domain-containing protein [Bacteroidota bacterium]